MRNRYESMRRASYSLAAIVLGAMAPCLATALTPTVTALTISPQGAVSASAVITLSATVTAGGVPVSHGSVIFCDATAVRCENSAILAERQLTIAGTATAKIGMGVGTYSIKAVFQGTSAFAGSASAASPINVIGTISTTTSIGGFGTSTNQLLTATVNAYNRPTLAGTVSFLDKTTNNALLGTGSLGAVSIAYPIVQQFSPPPYNFSVNAVAVGDFNGDGLRDMVYPDGHGNLVIVLTTNGSPGNLDSTYALTPLTNAPAGTSAIAAALVVDDFNRDGVQDIAAVETGGIDVFSGKGDGTFTSRFFPFPTALAAQPQGIGTGDFNGDGILDLAVSDSGGSSVFLLIGNGDGTFSTKAPVTTCANPGELAVADFDGDGFLDLAATSSTGCVSLLLGNGNGSFHANSPIDLTADVIAAGDFNGDGIPDLFTAHDMTNTVLLGVGDGTFTAHEAPLGATVVVGDMALADMNGDGLSDAITVGYDGIEVYLGNRDGTFQPPFLIPAVSSHWVAVTDLNNDGVPDLLSVDEFGDIYQLITAMQASASATANITAEGAQQVYAKYEGDAVYKSSVSSSISISGATSAPSFNPLPGTYEWTQNVQITDANPSALIYYTLDGTTPTASSTPYTTPIVVGWDATITAVAVVSGVTSPPATGVFTIDRPLPPPAFSLTPGSYAAPQTISLTDDPSYCAHATCEIYYTLDGTTPTTSSRLYSIPIDLTAIGSTTIRAIATAHHFLTSATASATYVLQP